MRVFESGSASRLRYNVFNLIRQGLSGHHGWPAQWRTPEPKAKYDVVIIGGGGHGLATAYYLAKNHGITNVAVLEKAWIGGGNSGRNTTVIRSNYFFPQSAALYDLSLRLYERLSRDLDYNIMLSQRGMVNILHSRHDVEMARRQMGAMVANGIDAELLTVEQVRDWLPHLDTSRTARYPVWGGFAQRRAGTARHDAVVWAYARAASALGVDILQNCEVLGFEKTPTGRIAAVRTTRGLIETDACALAVAGHSTRVAAMMGIALPITSYALQAFVTEAIKPTLDRIVLSLATSTYLTQSDHGGLVIGGALDRYASYAQRGNMPVIRQVLGAVADQFPAFGRVRLLRQWAGIVDVVQDSSPILGESTVPGLYLNCGWGTGGFKAIPAGGWLLAHHIATGQPHDVAAPFTLSRFSTGALIDEAAASGIAH
jgi:sarcosine oxidase, subunit beta